MARVPADSEWRKAKNVYYPANLREASEVTSGLGMGPAPTVTATEWPSTTQASLSPLETSKGPGKAGDHGQGLEVAKGKEVGHGKARPKEKTKGKEEIPKAKESEQIKP